MYMFRYSVSTLLVLLGHYFPLWLQQLGVVDIFTRCALIMLLWETTLWVCVFAFWTLDQKFPTHPSKRKPFSTSPPFLSMAKVSFRNEVLTIIFTLLLFPAVSPPVFSLSWLPFPFLETFLFMTLYVIGYDLVFFFGHRAMHVRSSWLGERLLRWHDTHHSSFADSGVSHHFMGLGDYFLETVLPVFFPVLLLGYHESAFAAVLVMGGFNGVVVHSGWDLAFLPDPKPHSQHHRKHGVNFGLGIFDAAIGTYDSGDKAG